MPLSKNRILELFHNGIDCSQIVFSQFSSQQGLDEDSARKISAAFGAGMFHGSTCGCVTGALMALGLKYGHSQELDHDTKNAFLEKKQQFETAFCSRFCSLSCSEILGADISTPEGMAKIQEEGLLDTLCPDLVCAACKILEELL